jgi:hypothetical protein
VHPRNLAAQTEGGIVWGLGHVLRDGGADRHDQPRACARRPRKWLVPDLAHVVRSGGHAQSGRLSIFDDRVTETSGPVGRMETGPGSQCISPCRSNSGNLFTTQRTLTQHARNW